MRPKPPFLQLSTKARAMLPCYNPGVDQTDSFFFFCFRPFGATMYLECLKVVEVSRVASRTCQVESSVVHSPRGRKK